MTNAAMTNENGKETEGKPKPHPRKCGFTCQEMKIHFLKLMLLKCHVPERCSHFSGNLHNCIRPCTKRYSNSVTILESLKFLKSMKLENVKYIEWNNN